MATVTIQRSFSAAPETVFDAWVDPALARQWLFATDGGEMVTAEIDPRVGGGFNLTDRREDVDVAHMGTYVEFERPRRLVFDFKVEPYSKGEMTRVSVDIAPQDAGSVLTLTHAGVWEGWEEKTQQGWEVVLGRLAEVLGEA